MRARADAGSVFTRPGRLQALARITRLGGLLVIRDLMFTDRRTYSDMLSAEERVATNVLAARLKQLEAAGIIRKIGRGRGSEYGLTEKGLDLLPVMLQLVVWSAMHDRRTAATKGFVNRIRKDPVGVAAEIRARLRAQYGSTSSGQKPATR